MAHSIYHLKLHEKITIKDGSIDVMRVPGGWIYNHYEYVYLENYQTSEPKLVSSTFVPFDNDFQNNQT